jgi:hypothetical protein
LYPRLRIAARNPLARIISESRQTKGVFPVPPKVMFPTLTTLQGRE